MATKNRTELKNFFLKNAIPTEGNFADLIDSGLNQSQDGVFKLEGEPLSIVAASGTQKRVLRMYSSYPAVKPDWMITLGSGLSFTDDAGNAKFSVGTNGNVGINTATPGG